MNEVTDVTDTQGNAWVKIKELTNGNGAAGAGAMISVWGCVPSGTYGTTSATVTFAVAELALSVYFIAIPISAGTTVQVDGTDSVAIDASTGFGSQSITGLSSENRAYLSFCCKEGNGTTAITATSGWTSFGLTGQNGPTVIAANHIMYRAEYKVATSTGETSNPTWSTSGDAASVMIALKEQIPYVTNVDKRKLLRWNGSAWVPADMKDRRGSSWPQSKVKYWDGSSWVPRN